MASSPTSTGTAPPLYWCYQCDRFVRAASAVACPACGGGFLEEMAAPPRGPYLRRPRAHHHATRRRTTGAAAGDRASPFNPIIVLRRSDNHGSPGASSSFELFYDDGAGSGLRPLPESMSDFLMASGFDRLLDQLARIDASGGLARATTASRDTTPPPASKAAVESMPTVTVDSSHVAQDSHCAVCKDAFELGAEAKEMPCNHIYHRDCILPWLQLRNSCPVCRHQMPTGEEEEDEDTVGLTIWRLPGGDFAVGRFADGRPEESDLLIRYDPSTQTSTVRRVLRSVLSCFGVGRS